MPFLSTTLSLDTYDRNGKAEWIRRDGFVYQTPAGHRIEAPRGDITDLASVPWGARALYKRDSLALRWPSQPHDWLCRLRHLHRHYSDDFGPVPDWLTRDYADRVLLWALLDNTHCSRARAHVVYRGTHAGSWWSWRQAQKAITGQVYLSLKDHGFDFEQHRDWAFVTMKDARP